MEKKTLFSDFSDTYTLLFKEGSLVITKPELCTYGKYFEGLFSSAMRETISHEIRFTDDKRQDFELLMQFMKGASLDFTQADIWHPMRDIADRLLLVELKEALSKAPKYKSFQEMIFYAAKVNIMDVSAYARRITGEDLAALRALGYLESIIIEGTSIPLQLKFKSLKGISSNQLTIITTIHWKQYVDLEKYGLSFEGVPIIKNTSRLRNFIALQGDHGCTLMRIPKGLTLAKLVKIVSPFFKVSTTYFKNYDEEVPSGAFIMTNSCEYPSVPIDESTRGNCRPSISQCMILSYFSLLLGAKFSYMLLVDELFSFSASRGSDGPRYYVQPYVFFSNSTNLRISLTPSQNPQITGKMFSIYGLYCADAM
jgi:hypothetical protein